MYCRVGVENVDPKPESNVVQTILFQPFIHFLGLLMIKMMFLFEKYFMALFSDSDSPVHGEYNE